jgi:hypothetical protein
LYRTVLTVRNEHCYRSIDDTCAHEERPDLYLITLLMQMQSTVRDTSCCCCYCARIQLD